MKLYHGTNIIFDKIDLLASKPNKDFGRGFYLSHDYNQALNMAHVKVEQQKEGQPIVMEFEVRESEMNALKILRFEDYSEEWAKFVLANRNGHNEESIHDYDVVIGPIADDKVGIQLWRYESQMIDIKDLIHNLKYMKGLTIQYFFGTENAISILRRIK